MFNSIISFITKVDSFINNIVWGWPVIILILGTGLLMSIRTGFLQLTHFKDSLSTTIGSTFKGIGKKKKSDRLNSVSQFEAFSAAISGTVGTGNIIGVAMAIISGGPGAVFWMWISAFFGMVTNYSENVLGLYYREKDKDGNLSGGAFYYLKNGLNCKFLGYLAAIFCVLAAIGMSGVQNSKIVDTLAITLGSNAGGMNSQTIRLIIGCVVAALTAIIIIGGIKRIGKVASMLVPVMSVLFICLALFTIFKNVTSIPSVFGLIFRNAFNFKAAGSGVLGYTFATVIKKGMARGVFSNEAGLGSSVIAHSASETREPVIQGLWGVFEVFFDTFIVCTLTALFILTTWDINTLSGDMSDTLLALNTFKTNFGTAGAVFFSIILPLFAFTTIIAWSYYGEKATEFCFQKLGAKGKKTAGSVFKIIFVLLIVASSLIQGGTLIWSISDTCNGLMAIPNLIAVVGLSSVVAKITKNYFDRKKGLAVEPMLSADPKLNKEFTEDIKECH